jgi:hypothetical protein
MGQFNPADLLEFFIRDRVYRLDWIFAATTAILFINTGAPDAHDTNRPRRCRKQQQRQKEQER